ncbi:SDR family NAD(P)-dependent oxidoreductase [bacterium]|nr:MAG: SDR family NAD(P)-dependent oxidoreductase [bacterium]
MKNIIIIGATSGIGRALALAYLKKGYQVGVTGRRIELLQELVTLFPKTCLYSAFDITQETAIHAFQNLVLKMGSVDLVIVNSGIGNWNPRNEWEIDKNTIETNVTGFARMSMAAFSVFLNQGFGHLVGISSVASYFGYGKAAAYNASKSFVSNYLSGLRHRAILSKKDIFVTDIQPGFITTPLIANKQEVKGAISAERMAEIVIPKLERHPKIIIVPYRWKFAVLLAKILPDSLIQRMS